jgi:succinate-semialdehyde dehydrogenase/glutarate-semialdehyde dehydrogenase
MALRSINPKNGELIAEFEPTSRGDIDRALARADRAFSTRRSLDFRGRAEKLHALGATLDTESTKWGRLLTDEMGKTLDGAIAEVRKCAWVCRHYADHAEEMLREVELDSDARWSAVMFRPLGPILAVMPWNFPFWQVFRFAAPAVMAGNVVLLKHASNVPRAALALQSLFESAGFEPGVFQTLLIGPESVEALLADDRVKAASVTGSIRAGSSVASIAGRYVKKTVLELGGSDPFIVMPSANLEQALDTAVTARTINNGQSCIAAKRFIVHADIYEDFVEGFVQRFDTLTVGDPVESSTDVGPMAMDRSRERLETQIRTLLASGAERLTGAEPIDGPGYYFRPGILAGVDDDAPRFDEELFGPVAWLLKVESFEEALACANGTSYGLGSSLWSQDDAEIKRACRDIEAGATFVNSMVMSDPRLPFGGIKSSGYGRELARDGIVEFVNRKTIAIA